MTEILRQRFPEVDELFSGRLAPKFERMLSRIPRLYRTRSARWKALLDLDLAEDEEDSVFLTNRSVAALPFALLDGLVAIDAGIKNTFANLILSVMYAHDVPKYDTSPA